MRGKAKILVVDDDLMNLELIEDYLFDLDVQLLQTTHGAQAWNILEHSSMKIDLVLLDRMMPNMDGMKVLAKMRERPEMKRIPVIMQTPAVTSDEVAEGIEAGVFHYLVKPFTADSLISLVKTALQEKINVTEPGD